MTYCWSSQSYDPYYDVRDQNNMYLLYSPS